MAFSLDDPIDHQVMTTMFNSLDADSDGKLTMNELMGLFGDMKSEAARMMKPFFEACDKDGDKKINLEEFKEFYKIMEESSDSEEEDITAGGGMTDETLEMLFRSLDTDEDGKLVISDIRALLEEEEGSPNLQRFFDACDTDKDQRITLEEFKAFYQKQEETKCDEQADEGKTYGGMTEKTMEKLFKSLDADSDGTLVMNDLKAMMGDHASEADMKPFFDACDTNGDKRITLDEFKAFYISMGEDQEKAGDEKEPEKAEGDKKESEDGGMTEETMEKLFKSLDADSDGTLVMNDLKSLMGDHASEADMKPFFDACDTNGDKRITLEEFKAFYKNM